MAFTLLRRNQLIPVPPPDKAVEFLEREGKPRPGAGPAGAIVGSPEKVRAGVEAWPCEYGAEEVIVVTITYDHQARRRSYELLAEAFGLEPRTVTNRALLVAALTRPRPSSRRRHRAEGTATRQVRRQVEPDSACGPRSSRQITSNFSPSSLIVRNTAQHHRARRVDPHVHQQIEVPR